MPKFAVGDKVRDERHILQELVVVLPVPDKLGRITVAADGYYYNVSESRLSKLPERFTQQGIVWEKTEVRPARTGEWTIDELSNVVQCALRDHFSTRQIVIPVGIA